MEWEIEFLPSAVKELASLPPPVRQRIGEKIDGLRAEPRPPTARLLRGGGRGLYRLRTGSYRILYRVRDRVVSVLIVRVGLRRDIYRGL